MRMHFSPALLAVAVLFSWESASASAVPAELKVVLSGRAQTLSLAQLKKRLKSATLTVQDPVYKKEKTYEGFWLADVLKLAGMTEAEGDEIVFTCADGYAPTLSFSKMKAHKGLVAFREPKAKAGWQKFQQGKAWMTPAPFYIVWDASHHEVPWPYQVVGIEVIRFKEKYSRIFPETVETTSPVYKGFTLFKGECLRCHSLNLQGGDLAPELNYPKNITEYWEDSTLLAFVRDPGQFRARSKMPAFPQLKEQDLSDLLSYLKWIKNHKKSGND